MLARSRMAEWYRRVVREEMLAAYGWAAELHRIEVSVLLHGGDATAGDTRYRAGALLETLTGRRPGPVAVANLAWEDPMKRRGAPLAGGADEREAQARLAAARRAVLAEAKAKKGVSVAGEMRKLSAGGALKLAVGLRGDAMWDFAERLREFYLPDMVNGVLAEAHPAMPRRVSDVPEDAPWLPGTCAGAALLASKSGATRMAGSPDLAGGAAPEYRGLRMQFEKRGGSVRRCYPPRYALTRHTRRDGRVLRAATCYVLRVGELLRLPDVEAHFEALGPLAGALGVYVRPEMRVETPQAADEVSAQRTVESLVVMNHGLSQVFSPFLFRPYLD